MIGLKEQKVEISKTRTYQGPIVTSFLSIIAYHNTMTFLHYQMVPYGMYINHQNIGKAVQSYILLYILGQHILPDPSFSSHILRSFPRLSCNNHRYLPPSKNLPIHVVLSLCSIIRIHKLNKCKTTRFPAQEQYVIESSQQCILERQKHTRIQQYKQQSKLLQEYHSLLYLFQYLSVSFRALN